jgi:DNA-binding transcriptional ArsR family regulator
MESDLARILVALNIASEKVDRVIEALCRKSPAPVSQLLKEISLGNMGPGELTKTLLLMYKRGLVTLMTEKEGTHVALNKERLRLLVYKNFLLEFVTEKWGESECAVLEYFILNHTASRDQLLADFEGMGAYFPLRVFNVGTVEEAWKRLVDLELLCPLQAPTLGLGVNGEVEAEGPVAKNGEALEQTMTINIKKLYTQIRASVFHKFLTQEVGPTAGAIGLGVLIQSSLFGLSSTIKRTERFTKDQVRSALHAHAPGLLKPTSLNDEFAKLTLANTKYWFADPATDTLSLNMDVVANHVKLSLVEDHVKQILSKSHVRVLRAIAILKLQNIAAFDEYLLLNKPDLRIILHDLERLNLIRKIHLHEGGETFEFQDNITQFISDYAGSLFKIVKNLLIIKEKSAREDWGHEGADGSKLKGLKAESAVAAIGKTIFILLEI